MIKRKSLLSNQNTTVCTRFYFINIYRNIKISCLKSSENIQKKEVGPDRSVSDNLSSSVTLNELAMKARKNCNFEFQQGSHTLTDINLNGVQII